MTTKTIKQNDGPESAESVAGGDSVDRLVGPCFVRMFKPQFAPLVESWEKLQTVRPTPKRMPQAGDRISLRAWTGKPYRSKQRILRESKILKVDPVIITHDKIYVGGQPVDRDAFAWADGFRATLHGGLWWSPWLCMYDWFVETHGLPFEGIVIHWSNDQGQESPTKTN